MKKVLFIFSALSICLFFTSAVLAQTATTPAGDASGYMPSTSTSSTDYTSGYTPDTSTGPAYDPTTNSVTNNTGNTPGYNPDTSSGPAYNPSTLPTASSSSNSSSGWNLDDISGFGFPDASVGEIVVGVFHWLLGLFSIVSLIAFMVAGLMYLLAAGDENTIGKAKKAMTFSIIGVIVGLSGLVIWQAVLYMLSGYSTF